jgi:hypothetical protein
MKIAFFCRSLEPGRDGVGDYSRRLAGELIRQGHPSVVVALNDPYLSETVSVEQAIEETSVSVLRLPSVLSWSDRIVKARKWLDAFNPDWASLQFVPYAFHQKGLCFGLGKRLSAINRKALWHVMFHELWLGLEERSPLKHRIIGALQRSIIMDCMRRLRPPIVHTQTESHRIVLGRQKIKASILPLFGNIPYAKGEGWEGLLEPLVTKAIGQHEDRNQLYLAGVLGMVYREWNAEQTVNTILPLVQRFQKRLVLVFHGKSDLNVESLNQLRSTLRNRADVIMTGEKPAPEISKILQTLDLGLATTPRQMVQKSGAVTAMLEHGLPILVTRNDWRLCGATIPPEELSDRLIWPEQFALLTSLPTRVRKPSEESGVKRVADKMLHALELPSPTL